MKKSTSFLILFLTALFPLCAHDSDHDHDRSSRPNDYDLYERNEDDADFNPYNFPPGSECPQCRKNNY